MRVSRPYKNIDGTYEYDDLKVIMWKKEEMLNNKENDVIGIRGTIENRNNEMVIVAEKITFLSTNKEE